MRPFIRVLAKYAMALTIIFGALAIALGFIMLLVPFGLSATIKIILGVGLIVIGLRMLYIVLRTVI